MSNSYIQKIKQRGYWKVIIRPKRFEKERIGPLKECEDIIIRYQVKHRGWYFPHFKDQDIKRKLDFIELSTSFMSAIESWRFYQSGQFAFYRALTEDWLEEESHWTSSDAPKPGSVLAITTPLYFLSEVYEFASRLGQAGFFDDKVQISIDLINLKDRVLWSWPGEGRHFSQSYASTVNELPKEKQIEISELITNHAEISFLHFEWILERFGFELQGNALKRDQQKFFEGRY